MREPTDLILRHVFRFRRAANISDPCVTRPCHTCFGIHKAKLEYFIRQNIPIEFVILAFPAKSPNPRKVLGPLPDLGEQLAIEFLQSFCEQLSHFHPPGAQLTVASDGHVFGDLVGVPDNLVTAYRKELADIIERTGAEHLSLYALDDAFPLQDYPAMRDLLECKYAQPIENIRQAVRTDTNQRYLFNGIHRFVFEDQFDTAEGLSRNQIRQRAKLLAYSVMQRSDAWSRLVAERFPQALRLSIHPQQCHSEKIGFQLLQTAENWFTPWHAVALDDGAEVRLVRRSTAEQLAATLVWRKGRPSHFVAPPTVSRSWNHGTPVH